MALQLPWLDYEAHREPEDCSGEVLAHYLNVTVNDIGLSALTLDTFYRDGVDVKPALEWQGELFSGPDGFDQEAFEEALRRDPF